MDPPAGKRRRVCNDSVFAAKQASTDEANESREDPLTGAKQFVAIPSSAVQLGRDCPYMHTINCESLDFDFEKVCSVSLESHNLYACLVCGKYFQGRGPSSHAFAHALDASHHLFLNLETETAYSIPDNLQIVDPLIDRIASALRPKFTPAAVAALSTTPRLYRTLNGSRHLQGITALDNLHASDYANVVFQVLFTVTPLRNYLLLAPPLFISAALSSSPQSRLLGELSSLAQKVWNPDAFRGHVSPHEVMQSVENASGARFGPSAQADPADFFAWLIHTLHREVHRIGKKRASGRNFLRDCFRGNLEVMSLREEEGDAVAGPSTVDSLVFTKVSPFWFLPLDLPPIPLFKDASERTLVAQVGLSELLKKYDGTSQHHMVKTGERLTYRLLELPQFLMLTMKRVTKSKFATEKNNAVLHCPVNGLDMRELLSCKGLTGTEPLIYNLLAIVIHDGSPDRGTYRAAVRHNATSKWFNIDHMAISEVLPQVVSLSDTCMLLYERA
jgi:U4/U6.U5 tri-snRNP-associated protein 2